jgi:glutamate synthase (NADPH/NADH) small chain
MRHGAASVIQLEMLPKSARNHEPIITLAPRPKVCKTDYGQEEAIAVFWRRSPEYIKHSKRNFWEIRKEL